MVLKLRQVIDMYALGNNGLLFFRGLIMIVIPICRHQTPEPIQRFSVSLLIQCMPEKPYVHDS